MAMLQHGLSAFRKLSILIFVGILFLAIFVPVAQALDSDGDGLSDEVEIRYHTDPSDSDSDDDGVLDGDEDDWNKNSDGTGDINALDHDSDDDGIFDGTEKGVTVDELTNDTDLSKGHFIEDLNPLTTTSMVDIDTDNDCLHDGEEDKNKNGRIDLDLDESDPNFPDRDGDAIRDDEDDDIDGDGMSNEFEDLFELDNCDPTDADRDDDLDGFTNLREFLGDDNSPLRNDWSEPNDHTSTPDLAPVVRFLEDPIKVEAGQEYIFDSKVFQVLDSERDWELGLEFTWDWGDGSKDIEIVYDSIDYSITHKYSTKGDYTVTLSVEDNFDHPPESDTTEMVISEPPVPVKPNNGTKPSDDGPIGVSTEEKSASMLSSFFWIIIIIIILVFVVIAIVVYFTITKQNEAKFQQNQYWPSQTEPRIKPVDFEQQDRFVAQPMEYQQNQQYPQRSQNQPYQRDPRYPPPPY